LPRTEKALHRRLIKHKSFCCQPFDLLGPAAINQFTANRLVFSMPADKETEMPEMAAFLSRSITSARISMRAALAGLGPEDVAREPGPEWRSVESVLGEATMGLRDTLLAIGHADLPDVPEGFQARYARWGTGAEMDEAIPGLSAIFSEHLEALAGVLRTLGPLHLDEPSSPPGAFDEDGVFSFTTVEEMIAAVSGYVHFLAGETSVIRLALGKPAASDPFDELFNRTD